MRQFPSTCAGLIAVAALASSGVAVSAEASAQAGAYSIEVLDAHGGSLPSWWHGGRTFALGEEGQRYRIRVRNRSSQRVEAVISVDGRDAVDGKAARSDKPGYVIAPWGEVTVDGFRVSMRDVATFRFAGVADSYAAQMGDARNVGVIGVAIFSERRRPPPQPIAQPPHRHSHGDAGEREAAESRGSAGAAKGQAAAPRSECGPADRGRAAEDRPGLGTRFGERRSSQVVQVDFERQSAHRPDAVLSIRYNDAEGLLAAGVPVYPPRRPDLQREQWRRERARPFQDQPRAFASPPAGWDGEW